MTTLWLLTEKIVKRLQNFKIYSVAVANKYCTTNALLLEQFKTFIGREVNQTP